METKYFVNYSYKTIREFYSQGIITQAQWEAYDFTWANLHVTSFPYYWRSMLPDARIEFWKLYDVLPVRLQNILRPLAIG